MTIHDQLIVMSAFVVGVFQVRSQMTRIPALNNLFRFLVLQNLSSQGSICRTEMALLII